MLFLIHKLYLHNLEYKMKYELPNEIKDRVSKYYNFDSKSDFIFDTTNIFNIENISINTNIIFLLRI